MRAEKNLQRFTIEVDSYTLWSWFEESMRTARRLPSIKPKGYKAQWVDIPKDWLAYGWDKAYIKLPPPSGKQISRLALVHDLIAYVSDEDERKMLWMRANKLPWKKMEYLFGKHRSTLAKKCKNNLFMMTFVVNDEKTIRQRLQYCI
jgi:hypothetical protein